MNKTIAAFDSLNVSDSTIEYAIYLWKEFKMNIVAAFLKDIAYHGKAENGLGQPYEPNDWSGEDTYIQKEEIVRKAFIKKVQNIFSKEGVHYTIHHDDLIALLSLINESHFADMILINNNESFSATEKSKPSYFLKTLLADADCPVMIVPDEFRPIEKFIFTYDGSPASTYAIRFFTYLFPLKASHHVEILMVNDEATNHLPEHHLLKELLLRKFPVLQLSIIKSSHTSEKLLEYVHSQKESCMVIMGSYSRNILSRWLHKSTADILIAEADVPIFIAHK